MGRVLHRFLVGTEASFKENVSGKAPWLKMIPTHGVYWGDDGTLYLVTSKQWADYLHGRSHEIPDDDVYHNGKLAEISEVDFEAIISG